MGEVTHLHLKHSYRNGGGVWIIVFAVLCSNIAAVVQWEKPQQSERNHSGTFSMIASYPLHKASLSFPRRGEKASSVSEKIPHWPSLLRPLLLLLTDPTRLPPLLWKFSSPSLQSVSFHCCPPPPFPHLVMVSVCSLAYPYFSSTSPLSPLLPSLPPSISVCSFFLPSSPVFIPCCQEIFNMESYICFSPFSHPTPSQTQLPNGHPCSAFLQN